MRIDATDIGETQKPFFGNVRYHDPDFVHVSGDHHFFAGTVTLFQGNEVAHRINDDIVCQPINLIPDQLTDVIFKPRWTICFYQFFN